MSTSVLKALPGKLDIKRHSPSILYIQNRVPITMPVSINVLLVYIINNKMKTQNTENEENLFCSDLKQ